MKRSVGTSLSLAVAAIVAGAGLFVATGPANAVIYCRAVGVPHGCVARPGVAVVHPYAGAAVVRPVVARPVVYCKTVGVPKGCVMR